VLYTLEAPPVQNKTKLIKDFLKVPQEIAPSAQPQKPQQLPPVHSKQILTQISSKLWNGESPLQLRLRMFTNFGACNFIMINMDGSANHFGLLKKRNTQLCS